MKKKNVCNFAKSIIRICSTNHFILVPCDVENTCHQNAKCEWVESESLNKCVCNPGFEGNGYDCVEHEVSCLFVCKNRMKFMFDC